MDNAMGREMLIQLRNQLRSMARDLIERANNIDWILTGIFNDGCNNGGANVRVNNDTNSTNGTGVNLNFTPSANVEDGSGEAMANTDYYIENSDDTSIDSETDSSDELDLSLSDETSTELNSSDSSDFWTDFSFNYIISCMNNTSTCYFNTSTC